MKKNNKKTIRIAFAAVSFAAIIGISGLTAVYSILNVITANGAEIVVRTDTYVLETVNEDVIPADSVTESDIMAMPDDENFETGEYVFPSDSESVTVENETPISNGGGSSVIQTPSFSTLYRPPYTLTVGETEMSTFYHYDKYYEPKGTNTSIFYKEQADPDIFNFILLGRDTRDAYYDRGRTDSMVVVSYNKKTRAVKLISLQRDCLVPIEGHNWNRLNTAYFFGGVGLCLNTINDVFGLDLQNYVTVVDDCVSALIDKIGGITLYINEAEEAFYEENAPQYMAVLEVGYNHMNGTQVNLYMRNRTTGNSDDSRARRQRDILQAIYDKIISEYSITDMVSLITYAASYMATNFSNDRILSLASDIITGDPISIETVSLPFSGTYESAWYKKMLILSLDIESNRDKLHEFIYGN